MLAYTYHAHKDHADGCHSECFVNPDRILHIMTRVRARNDETKLEITVMNRNARYQLTLGNHQLRVATVLLMSWAPQAVPLLAADQIMAVGIDRKFTYNLESEKL